MATAREALETASQNSHLERVIDHPSGYLALSSRNRRFTVPGLDGFISYRKQGKHIFSMGGVHAAAGSREALLDHFLAEASRQHLNVIAVQVRESQAEMFRARGFTVNQLGSSYGLKLQGFSLAGTRFMKLRNKIKRARSAGLQVKEVGCDLPADELTFNRLQAVSQAWLKAKRKKELDFMVGELGDPSQRERRIFAVLNADDQMIGFISYVPAWGEYPGYLHDLTRRLPEVPPGTMELCNSFAMEKFIKEGVAYLHFGFTPFIVDEQDHPTASRMMSRFLQLLGRHGGAIYPAQSQVSYKLKWGPAIVERELIACRPLSIRAVFDLLILTRSV